MTASARRENLRPRRTFRIGAMRFGTMPSMLFSHILLLLLTSLAQSSFGQRRPAYEDCEQPPEIAYGSARITVDETEEFVTARYSCPAGFRLEGKADIRCDIDSDEWQVKELPKCVKESTDKDVSQQQPQKKRKLQNIQEETAIDDAFASQLDLSCMAQGLIHAPEIDNGYVVKYNRRRKEDHIFLVAFYECDDYYELQPSETDRLFCSGKQWIGKTPNCVSTGGDGEEDEEEEDEDEDEDYDEGEEEETDPEQQPSESDSDKDQQQLPETIPTTLTTTTTTVSPTTEAKEEHPIHENPHLVESSSPPSPQHEHHSEEEITRSEQIHPSETHSTSEDENEVEENAIDNEGESEPIPEEPSENETQLRIATCGANRGGCDHECQDGHETHPEIRCSCYHGFQLDEHDGRTCHDIDECSLHNGGCEQTCTNKPGSFECSCQPGLQIDVLDGRSCIDINECLLRNGHGPCQDTCINQWATYNCTCEGLPNTRLSADGHGCEDASDCPKAGCSHQCLSTMGRIYCLCPKGFYLGDDWKTCQDVNECENPSIVELCPHGCENLHGSYRCRQPELSTTEAAPTEEENEEDGDDGYDDDEEEVDRQDNELDWPTTLSSTTTTKLPEIKHETLPEQTIPDDEDNDEDGDDDDDDNGQLNNELETHSSHTPEIDRSMTDDYDDADEDNKGQPESDRQLHEVEIHHPHRHHHGEEKEALPAENEIEPKVGELPGNHPPSSTSDDAEDEDGDDDDDYQEPDTEAPLIPITTSTSTTTVAPLLCREGLRLNSNGECEDIDECAEQEHGCDFCRNAYGGYECTCPAGYELADDDRSCQDVNECEVYAQREEDDYDEDEEGDGLGRPRAAVAICSHQCVNTVGSFECRCPDNFHLNNDRKTCVRDFCADLYENPNKTRCSHECKDGTEGFMCSCPEFHILDEYDLKTCRNVYSCGEEYKKRCNPGVCRMIEGGDYRCECPPGHQQHDHSCHDIDECELGRHLCSHNCHNTAGAYECSCPRGLQLSTDKRTCDDIDECDEQDEEELCGDLNCLNTYGSYRCVCPEGKELDEYGICRQMDLCTTDNGGCSHICTFFNRETFCDCPDNMELAEDGKSCTKINDCNLNNGGCSHSCDPDAETLCGCPQGFELESDQRTCRDVNECRESNGGCEQSCVNFEGGYKCSCYGGFVASPEDSSSCVDIDECSISQGGCDHVCHNTEGSFHCTCHNGYRLAENRHSCVDLNECEERNGNCSHVCINLLGGHQCSCPKGLYLLEDGLTCDFVNECELNNGGCSHGCSYEHGVVTCSCPKGFQLEKNNFKTCVDINECEHKNGGCSDTCTNLPGSYYCTCSEGFELGRNRHTCVDIDECIENNGNCSNICINLLGDFRCACEAGFELEDDQQTCRDVDECSTKIHDCSHICVNVPGTFECECPSGFVLGRDKFTCEDINECETLLNKGGCEHHCVNLPGSYRCGCEIGHRLEKDNRTCSDIDECSDEYKKCSHDCVNTKGGFECSCPSGLSLDVDKMSCLDIDECKINNFNGGCSHVCENQHGSFKCKCPEGMVLGDDHATCEDVDECSSLNGGCSQRCVNLPHSYRCECEKGFVLMSDNKTCEVSNPCALRNGGCEHFCNLREGIPQCSCRDGFVQNKTNLAKCVDIDECQSPNGNNCQQTCINTLGSYTCDCYSGYEKNDLGQCIDVNECLEQNGGCGHKAKCINLAGSFRCVCPPGHKMGKDRKSCLEIKDRCKPLVAPKNGDVRCSRSRHKTQLYYRTKCSITCKKGFKLLGQSIRQCNGTGQWGEEESLCIPQPCPRLNRPEHGTILPVACMSGKIFSGERCVLHCKPGYKPVGKRTTVCDTEQKWTPTPNLRCAPVATPAPVVIKPQIHCPADIHEVLPVGHYTMKIRFEQPKTNVDWYQFVDAHPAWGKQLEAELPAGETEVTFRARSPNSPMNDVCRVVIKIRERRAPNVVNCPDSFNVQLENYETSRSVYWVEPNFETESEIKQLYKSHTPGQVLIAGVHYVNYVATDADGLSAKCSFGITVKAPLEPYGQRRPVHQRPLETNRLEDHESYLICPGKSPILVDPNSPLHIPQGCVVKNIRIKQKLARLRHQQNVLQRHLQELEGAPNPDPAAIEQHHKKYNNFLRYYSSWDNAYSQQQSHGHQQPPHQEEPSYHHRMQTTSHPRRWFKKRSKDTTEMEESASRDKSADVLEF
ncbi:fibrillin-1-like isoform X2 [Armigeres subalbatus]|uniref:fibrillin-1-like isoform X2 n=1 Tax=Armigeres subalbatus TaxID=124917 RepID=UPI002ED0FBFD